METKGKATLFVLFFDECSMPRMVADPESGAQNFVE